MTYVKNSAGRVYFYPPFDAKKKIDEDDWKYCDQEGNIVKEPNNGTSALPAKESAPEMPTKAEMKKLLDKAGVEYDPRANAKELYEAYQNIEE